MANAKKPQLPEELKLELEEMWDGVEEQPSEIKQEYINAAKGRVEELSKEYEMPTGHQDTLSEGAVKVIDTASGGFIPRTALSAGLAAAGKMPWGEALAGLDPSTTQLAPSGERITAAAGIHEGSELDPYLPTEEQVEAGESVYGGLPARHISPTQGGLLGKLTPRKALSFGIDLLAPPAGAGAKLLSLAGKGAEAGRVAKRLGKVREVIGSPAQKAAKAVSENLYSFPSADFAAIEAGKGSTGKVLSSITEKPVSHLLKREGIAGGTESLGKQYDTLMAAKGAKAHELLEQSFENLDGPTSHFVDLNKVNKEARRILRAAQTNPETKEEAVRLLNDMDKKWGVPSDPDEFRRAMDPEAISDVVMHVDPATEEIIPTMHLQSALETKQILQRDVGKQWSPNAPLKSDLEVKVKRAQASGFKRALEQKVDTLVPEARGEFKKLNEEYGVLAAGREGFMTDIGSPGTRQVIRPRDAARLLTSMGLISAGAHYAGQTSLPATMALGAIAGGIATTNRGRTYGGKFFEKLGQQYGPGGRGVGADQLIRAAAIPQVSQNPYEELYRAKEKEQQPARSGRYRLPKETKR